MNGLYAHGESFKVALDVIIFGFDGKGLKLLLVHRNLEPEKGKWSLMGGFLRRNESLDQAAARVLLQLTGLQNVYLAQLGTFGEIDRDPVERVVSVAYYALIRIDDYDESLGKQHDAHWFPISAKPTLIFDHDQMVEAAKAQLRQKAASQPIGFELLPEKFTIPQLQMLYEAIYKTPFDKRNFSRKILSHDILVKLEEKQRGFSKKGAFFYRFDKEKYARKIENGFNSMI